MRYHVRRSVALLFLIVAAILSTGTVSSIFAQALPGGTLDPLTIPKYVTPLVIPPEMPKSSTSQAPAADYDIAVRQFKQQILPGGIWGTSFPDPVTGGTTTVGPFPATTLWSYGRAEDPLPDSSAIPGGAAGVAPAMNSSFNYPAFTVEADTMVQTSVRWINDLVDPNTGNYLPHLFNVDQTLHWSNPTNADCLMMPANRTDCETELAAPYTGPVPLVTHVHGAHVQPHSDGYPEAWWLPGAPGTKGIPASYAERGSHFTQADNTNAVAGSAYYAYENTQPATTLWYHDHALGMTRLNVYAGPAGFWLIRGGSNDLASGLPGPAPSLLGGDPNFDTAVRKTIREVPIAIQDRSFNDDGSLFYPADRTFFDGFAGPYIGGAGTPTGPSDISGIWNPEAFFNTMVVNGTTWPFYEVANGRYRLRLLNGCNSRTLNLALFTVTDLGADGIPGTADDVLGAEVPFHQIGAEQGFLPNVVSITTGSYTVLPGDGTIPAAVPAPDPSQALLMGPAERADVIVDFKGMANGTRIRMINTAPDAPFGHMPDIPADPLTTGQVMDFIVNTALEIPADSETTAPESLVLPAESPLGVETNTRQVSLNEMGSDQVCIEVDAAGAIVGTIFSTTPNDPTFLANCAAAVVAPGNFAFPMAPRQARLGILTTDGQGNLFPMPKRWSDAITEGPALNSTEVWEIYNATEDAHPIHIHLVSFQVVNRQALDPLALMAGSFVVTGPTMTARPNEMGYKDTVVAHPGQVTRIKAKFDIAGLYVWHCHIVEHEDNEMMRPFIVQKPVELLWRNSATGQNVSWTMNGLARSSYAHLLQVADQNWQIVGTGDFNADGQRDILWRNISTGNNVVWYMNGSTRQNYAYLPAVPDVNWQVFGTGDFNNDGKPDILWRNTMNGKNIVWFMDGITRTAYVYLPEITDLNWQIAATGDINNDSKIDILWRNSLNGDNIVWFMDGVVRSSYQRIPALADLNWQIVGAGDFNSDVNEDILWSNTATGENLVWYMNGATQVGTGAITPLIADTNWKIVGH